MSTDRRRWLLINASPDVRTQVLAFDAMSPPAGARRGSGIAAVAITNGDIDHATGLLVLREGGAPPIYSTARVRDALTTGLSILPALEAFGRVDWREIVPGAEIDVAARDGAALDIVLTAFAVASKPPPYMTSKSDGSVGSAVTVPRDDLAGDTIGLRIAERARPDAFVAYVPGVRDLDDSLRASIDGARLILFDGTCFADDELVSQGLSQKTARAMGHAAIEGHGGSLEFLRSLHADRKFYIHINNTNPILVDDSSARRAVESAGVGVAHDGLEIAV